MRFFRVAAVSIAVVNHYRVAWTRSYGVRNVATNASTDPSTLFQACSINVRLDSGTLIARSSFDGLNAALYAETSTRFFMLEGNTFVFARDRSGRVTSVETDGNTYARRP
jgi:hypothetical protein